jgi:hypothetical protein
MIQVKSGGDLENSSLAAQELQHGGKIPAAVSEAFPQRVEGFGLGAQRR